MNVKELFENEELMENIVEDIDEIPEDSEVTYEVWALGYNREEDCTDAEYLIGEFENPDEAIACADKLTLEAFLNEYETPSSDTAYLTIEVETVVEDPEDEGTMNLGSIYSRDLWIDGEYGSEEDFDPVVELATKDFDIVEDGLMKVSCKLLKGYNKNCYLRVRFVDEAESGTFLYKIISKVMYEDGDYYHCDLQL